MSNQVKALYHEPILMDRAAGAFGAGARGLGGALHEGALLTLTESALLFEDLGGCGAVEIPLAEIEELAVSAWRRPDGRTLQVLRVTHHENLILAVAVAEPSRWIAAIDALAPPKPQQLRVDARHSGPAASRGLRVAVGSTLILMLLLSVILPLVFSWMHERASRATPPPAPAALRPTGTGS
jgi:hypothetical protein